MANHQLIINRFPVIINLAAIVRGMSGQRLNRQLIINRFPVIVNRAALNLSPIHHQNGGIYHLGWRPPIVPILESSDKHPTKRRNHPTEPENRPINASKRTIWLGFADSRICNAGWEFPYRA